MEKKNLTGQFTFRAEITELPCYNKLKLFGMEMSGRVQVQFSFWKG